MNLKKLKRQINKAVITRKDWLRKSLNAYKSQICFIALAIMICVGIALVTELLFFNKIVPHDSGFFFSGSRFVSALIMCLVATLLVKFRRYFLSHLEKAFLMIAVPMGVLFILVLPKTVYVSQDDQIHLQRAYAFLSPSDIHWSRALRLLEMPSTHVEGFSLAKTDEIYDQLNAAHAETEEQQVNFGDNSLLFSRLIYLPYFIGFKFSEFLNLNFIDMIMVAKFCNLLCYVLILYFAIKISTHAQKIFFVLAVLLSNMFYATQFSHDPLITANIMLAIALFLRMLEMERIPPRYVVFFALAGVWASLPKAIYCPILLLLLFVPSQKFGGRQRARACKMAVVGLTILMAATFVLPILSGSMQGDFRGGDTSVSQQILFILHNPLRFSVTFTRYTTNNLPTLILVESSSIGIYQPYNYTRFVLPTINFVYIILLCYVVFTSHKPAKIYTKQIRAVLIVAYFLIIYAAIGALYLCFTPVGHSTIEGFQERYLLPLLPLALVALIPTTSAPDKAIEEMKPKFVLLAVPFLALALFLACYILRASVI